MSIHWGSLLNVFVVSVSATVAVVSLVTLGLVGLSGRAAPTGQADAPTGRGSSSATVRTALAVVCLVAASVIVLVGLWAIIDK
jgi:hypothetical protein